MSSGPNDHDPAQVEAFARQVHDAIDTLEAIVADRGLLTALSPEVRKRLLMAAGQASRPDKKARKKMARAHRRREKLSARDEDEALLDRTGIRMLRENPIFQTPRRRLQALGEPVASYEHAAERFEVPRDPVGRVSQARTCYVCQAKYHEVHFFYDQMCQACGDFNYLKRSPSADLSGRVALITGARVKIGYQAAIMMLRAGCHVIVLTRFPRDAARRYSQEGDFNDWQERLEIHGVDLRHIPSVEALCAELLKSHDRLDYIINNACQTVRRPPGFYDHLLEGELGALSALPEAARALLGPSSGLDGGVEGGGDEVHALQMGGVAIGADGFGASGAVPAPLLSQIPLVPEDLVRGESLFPTGRLDADLQQVDLREVNSWRLKLAEVSTVELLEVQLVNAVAPFVLNARLKPLMLNVPTQDKHIVNVSAMEGQFYRHFKSDRHPHTNMAKAALNMMTRTAALDYIKDGIHMNSVDTGWVTDEDPVVHAERKREVHRFHPPLDIVDGAARIVDPIFSGVQTGEHIWGQFLKDYRVTDW